MADPAVMVQGLKELKDQVEKLPDVVIEALRDVAEKTAHRVMERAKQLVPVATGYTRDNIHVQFFPEEKTYVVNAGTDRPRVHFATRRSKRSGRTHTQKVTQNNLPIWLERGTRFMVAKPFMRPAADAENDRYKQDMANAAEAAVKKALG